MPSATSAPALTPTEDANEFLELSAARTDHLVAKQRDIDSTEKQLGQNFTLKTITDWSQLPRVIELLQEEKKSVAHNVTVRLSFPETADPKIEEIRQFVLGLAEAPSLSGMYGKMIDKFRELDRPELMDMVKDAYSSIIPDPSRSSYVDRSLSMTELLNVRPTADGTVSFLNEDGSPNAQGLKILESLARNDRTLSRLEELADSMRTPSVDANCHLAIWCEEKNRGEVHAAITKLLDAAGPEHKERAEKGLNIRVGGSPATDISCVLELSYKVFSKHLEGVEEDRVRRATRLQYEIEQAGQQLQELRTAREGAAQQMATQQREAAEKIEGLRAASSGASELASTRQAEIGSAVENEQKKLYLTGAVDDYRQARAAKAEIDAEAAKLQQELEGRKRELDRSCRLEERRREEAGSGKPDDIDKFEKAVSDRERAEKGFGEAEAKLNAKLGEAARASATAENHAAEFAHHLTHPDPVQLNPEQQEELKAKFQELRQALDEAQAKEDEARKEEKEARAKLQGLRKDLLATDRRIENYERQISQLEEEKAQLAGSPAAAA